MKNKKINKNNNFSFNKLRKKIQNENFTFTMITILLSTLLISILMFFSKKWGLV